VEGNELRRFEAMILSMTPQERRDPDRIDVSRQNRIARGSGHSTGEVSELLKRFMMMRDMFAQLKQSGLGSMLGGKGGRPGAAPGGGKIDPAQLQELAMGGGMPNRAAARAMKAEAKRQAKKSKRKHQRKQKRRR